MYYTAHEVVCHNVIFFNRISILNHAETHGCSLLPSIFSYTSFQKRGVFTDIVVEILVAMAVVICK